MANKTYFVKKETHYSYEDEHEEDQFIVIEAERLGQYYFSSKGYEYPRYCWTLRERKRCLSYDLALAYIDGVKSGLGIDHEASIRHPTMPSSCNGPGQFPLAGDGGPLLFTIVSDAVKCIRPEDQTEEQRALLEQSEEHSDVRE